MTKDDLLYALQDANIGAFLRVIREGESSQDPDAYRMLFGGELITYFGDHPRKLVTKKLGGKEITSSAAGAYQFLKKTWDALVRQYGFKDFQPVTQDMAAVALIAEKGALDLIREGHIREAIARCAPVWASLPGSQWGQPTQKLERALAVYREYGGTLATEAAANPAPVPQVKKESFMSPFVLPFLQVLSGLIPSLSKLGFGSGSEVANRNVAAGGMVVDAVVQAVGAANEAEALKKIQSDPAALQAAKDAAEEVVWQVTEAGGGGLEGARKYSADLNALPFWKQPAFWFFLSILPLVYMLSVSILFGVGGVEWGVEVKVMVATAIVGIIAVGSQYFLGSSYGSQKKDNLLGGK